MIRKIISSIMFMGGLVMSSCATTTPIPPPTQGPAVVGNNVEIDEWKYLGSDYLDPLPLPDLSGPNVREVGNDIYEIWLIQEEAGFDLVWTQFPCATQPVVIVHADASIEFWPGEIVGSHCEAISVSHMLTVQWKTDIPFEEWKFIFHPPPEPES